MRKLLSCVLALLVLALPAAGLAASSENPLTQAMEDGRTIRTDITFTPGVFPVDEEIAVILSDLLESLSFTVEASVSEGAPQRFAMGLGGKDVCTLAFQQAGDVFYADSSLLDNTVAYTPEEYQAIMIRAAVLGAQAQNMSQEDIDAMVAAMEAEAQTGASVAEEMQGLTLDMTELESVTQRMAGTVKEESYTGSSKNHDAATRKLTMTMAAEDIVEVMRIVCEQLRANEGFMACMEFALSMTGGSTDVQTLMTELPDWYGEQLEKYEDIAVTCLAAENGDLVHMDVTLVPKEEELAKNADIPTGEGVYNRLTTADGVGHSVEYTINVQESKVALALNVLTASEKRIAMSAAITYVDKNGTLYDMAHLTVDGVKDRADGAANDTVTVELAAKKDVTDDEYAYGARIDAVCRTAAEGKDVTGHTTVSLTLLGEKEPMLTVNVDQTTVDEPEDIVSDEADRPGQMSDEEFATYSTKVQASILTNVMTILQNLPESLLRLVFSN